MFILHIFCVSMGGITMRLSMNQQLEMKIAMTQQLGQAIRILEMSSIELEGFLEEMQTLNPLIEIREHNTYKERSLKKINKSLDFSKLDVKSELSPVEKLFQQIRLSVRGSIDLNLLYKMIFNLNEVGYLPNALQLMSESEYKHMLNILRNSDYVGVGALNLKHSLSLQVQHYYPNDQLLLDLIENLEWVAERKFKQLTKLFQITEIHLKELINKIKTLNPRPFITLNSNIELIHPDVVIEIENRQISYALSSWFAPAISIHKIKGLSVTNGERNQITEWEAEAKWINQALEQRKATMKGIMEFLIEYQFEAFTKGLDFVKPLTLKDVSIVINRHESTVSRATMNKYIQTPWGIFSMKELFSSKISTTNGESLSKDRIKHLVKELIHNEDKSKPLSDQKLSKLICLQENLGISRRTITKYREELLIPPSTKRREL